MVWVLFVALFCVFLCFPLFFSSPPPPYVLISVCVASFYFPAMHLRHTWFSLTVISHSIKAWSSLPNNSILLSSAYQCLLMFLVILFSSVNFDVDRID